MYYTETFVKQMETCNSDMNNECLITDLVDELSSGLEIPFLLGENIGTSEKQGNSITDIPFYEESAKEDWAEEIYSKIENNFSVGESMSPVKNEIIDDFDSYFENNSTTRTFSSSTISRSGSECSSTEIWMTKNELDTPPVTPPDERVSPESIFLLPPDELRFMPITADDNLLLDQNKTKNLSNIPRKVRIQPKPVSATLNIFDTQSQDLQTVVCSVFSDINSNNVKNQSGLLEANIFSNSNYGRKKSVLSKKDLELLQAKKKQERMIRNRESAYLSRKRKKEHVAHLEKQVHDLQAENTQLRLENCHLRQRLAKYEDIELTPIGRKSGSIFTDSPRKTTALLALLFTICLNIGSFSSFINEKRVFTNPNEVVKENMVPYYSSDLRHTRSLLWTENDLQNLNSTFINLTKTSCPLSINQTESIRLESELRRWIGGDEDHTTRSLKYNKSKINQYFYSGEKPSWHKNKSKHKQRSQNFNNRRKNVEMKMYQTKPNLFDFHNFFETIHRRDDTFYLLSFSGDHLLLPALSHNKTSRPKMSLMLPAVLSNGTGADQVEMMQIDCEVTNTQLLSVNENDIPSLMKPYSNTTSRSKSATTEQEKYAEYFGNDLTQALLNKKKNARAGKRDLTHPNISTNHSNILNRDSNKNSESHALEIIKIQYPQLHFNFSERNYKRNFHPESVREMYNHTYKQNQNAVDFTSSGKSLLKLLMVAPIPPNGKLLEFNAEKAGNALKNGTR